MIVLDVEQGSAAWHEARLGIPTASQFGRIVTPKRYDLSEQRSDYLDELIAQWALGEADEFGGTEWMERGKLLEPDARAVYSFQTDAEPETVGFVYRDESNMVGCSPDALVSTEGILELKSPMAKTHLGYLRRGELPRAYVLQVMGQIWVTGRQWCDFMSYFPGLPHFLTRVALEAKYAAALDEHIPTFVEDLLEGRQRLLDMGVQPQAFHHYEDKTMGDSCE